VSWLSPLVARFKAGYVAAHMLGLRDRIPTGHGCLFLVSVLFCQVEVSATGRSLVQRSPIECGVSECDREGSTMRRPRPSRGCRAKEIKPGLTFQETVL
jgi:hypothetical protein